MSRFNVFILTSCLACVPPHFSPSLHYSFLFACLWPFPVPFPFYVCLTSVSFVSVPLMPPFLSVSQLYSVSVPIHVTIRHVPFPTYLFLICASLVSHPISLPRHIIFVRLSVPILCPTPIQCMPCLFRLHSITLFHLCRHSCPVRVSIMSDFRLVYLVLFRPTFPSLKTTKKNFDTFHTLDFNLKARSKYVIPWYPSGGCAKKNFIMKNIRKFTRSSVPWGPSYIYPVPEAGF